jgi:hypothetical protein
MDVTAIASGSDSYPDLGNAENSINWQYNILGALDFDAFPAIPDNAQITKVEVQVDIEAVATGDASATIGSGSSAQTAALISFLAQIAADIGVMPTIQFSAVDNDPGNGVASVAVNQADHYTATETFDYSGAPITKAQLILDFTNWSVILQLIGSVTAQSS